MKMINELLESNEFLVVGYESDTMFSGTIYAIADDTFYTQFFYLKDGDGFNVEYQEIEKTDITQIDFFDDIIGNLMPVDWIDKK